jgi:hypothetical protein
MGNQLLINTANLLTGQRGKFLTDPVSDNKKEYCLIQKLHFFNSHKPSRDNDSLWQWIDNDNTILVKSPATYRSRVCTELQDHN